MEGSVGFGRFVRWGGVTRGGGIYIAYSSQPGRSNTPRARAQPSLSSGTRSVNPSYDESLDTIGDPDE